MTGSRPSAGRRAPRGGLATAGLASGVAAFQIALAAGAPWGELAWGGQHAGTLPDRLRVASAVSAAVWIGAAAVATHRGTGRRVQGARAAYAVLCGVGTVLNAVSPSAPERWLWTPVAAGLAVGFWGQARRPR